MSAGRPNRPYATVAAFDTALRARLKSLANERRSVQDLRKAVAFDRLLARLQIAAPESWLLKGGVALEYRLEKARATMDVDLTSRVALNDLHDALVAAAALPLGDYFNLRIGARSKPVADSESYRFEVDVLYENGALFEKLRVDVGFADPWIGEPQILSGQPLLGLCRDCADRRARDTLGSAPSREDSRLYTTLHRWRIVASQGSRGHRSSEQCRAVGTGSTRFDAPDSLPIARDA